MGNGLIAKEGHSRRYDIIILAVIVGIALVAALAVYGPRYLVKQAAAEQTGPYAVVQNDKGEHDVLPLSQDATITVESPYGYNVVTVENGSVSITDADCKNQICVETGQASYVGQTIICLPHHLVVQVVDKPEDAHSVG